MKIEAAERLLSSIEVEAGSPNKDDLKCLQEELAPKFKKAQAILQTHNISYPEVGVVQFGALPWVLTCVNQKNKDFDLQIEVPGVLESSMEFGDLKQRKKDEEKIDEFAAMLKKAGIKAKKKIATSGPLMGLPYLFNIEYKLKD